MKIVNVISSLESEAAGPTYTVISLTKSTVALGNEVTLYSLGSADKALCEGVAHFTAPADLDRFSLNKKLLRSRALNRVLMASCDADVFHIHGLWRMPNVYPANAARQHGRPLVLSPHGMLGKDALRFSRQAKRVFWAFAQGQAVRQVNCFHATSEQEYEEIRNFGLKQPVAIIPHGVDTPPLDMVLAAPEHAHAPYVVSLGRIHPKKALDRLIQAWALVVQEFPQWQLKIVGPSEIGYADQLQHLINKLGLNTIQISGPIFGQEKLALLRDAELFALPTLNENFAMTVPESLVCGTPVISTKGAPWSGLETNACGWWIEHGVRTACGCAKASNVFIKRPEARNGNAWPPLDGT